MVVIDTNVFSELLRPKPDAGVIAWLDGTAENVAISSISLAELTFGIRRLPRGRRRAALEAGMDTLLDDTGGLAVVGFSADAAMAAGAWRAIREASGQPVTFADSAIAGTCLAHGATLATRNTGDFTGGPLAVVNPWDSPN